MAGLKDRLLDPSTTSLFGFAGNNLPLMNGSKKSSQVHFTYSLNGSPTLSDLQGPWASENTKPVPSQLDLNGLTPKKYTDNLPG